MGNNAPPSGLSPEVLATGYVPFSELFPRAAAVVHPGGIGTTGQVLRAGRPRLVMPFNFDQPDNAARVVRLGVGRIIPRENYFASRVARELAALLDDSRYRQKAAQVSSRIRQEKTAAAAGEALERLLN